MGEAAKENRAGILRPLLHNRLERGERALAVARQVERAAQLRGGLLQGGWRTERVQNAGPGIARLPRPRLHGLAESSRRLGIAVFPERLAACHPRAPGQVWKFAEDLLRRARVTVAERHPALPQAPGADQFLAKASGHNARRAGFPAQGVPQTGPDAVPLRGVRARLQPRDGRKHLQAGRQGLHAAGRPRRQGLGEILGRALVIAAVARHARLQQLAIPLAEAHQRQFGRPRHGQQLRLGLRAAGDVLDAGEGLGFHPVEVRLRPDGQRQHRVVSPGGRQHRQKKKPFVHF